MKHTKVFLKKRKASGHASLVTSASLKKKFVLFVKDVWDGDNDYLSLVIVSVKSV